MANQLTLVKLIGGYMAPEELETVEIHEISDSIDKGVDIVADALISEKFGKNKLIIFIENTFVSHKKGVLTEKEYIVQLQTENDEVPLAVIFKSNLLEDFDKGKIHIMTPLQMLTGHEGKYGGCTFVKL